MGDLPCMEMATEQGGSRRWTRPVMAFVAVAALLVVVLVGYSLSYESKLGTYAWWGEPEHIEWCGTTYTNSGPSNLDNWDPSKLRTVKTIAPFQRRVMIPAGRPRCNGEIILRIGDDHYVSYNRPV